MLHKWFTCILMYMFYPSLPQCLRKCADGFALALRQAAGQKDDPLDPPLRTRHVLVQDVSEDTGGIKHIRALRVVGLLARHGPAAEGHPGSLRQHPQDACQGCAVLPQGGPALWQCGSGWQWCPQMRRVLQQLKFPFRSSCLAKGAWQSETAAMAGASCPSCWRCGTARRWQSHARALATQACEAWGGAAHGEFV